LFHLDTITLHRLYAGRVTCAAFLAPTRSSSAALRRYRRSALATWPRCGRCFTRPEVLAEDLPGR
jgi:hypothetical protein